MGEADPILLEKKGAVARITINRPEKRNAISKGVIQGMISALKQIENDASIKVVTTTGAGKIAWSAGYDMDYLSGLIHGDPANPDESGLELNEMIRNSSKVTIAVVNGFCLGGAVTLLLSHDLAIASDKAQIGLPEIFRGFPPRYVVAALVRAIPIKPAMEMLLTGRNLSAAESQQIGLINRVVSDSELAEAGRRWAEETGRYDGITLAYCKKSAYQCMDQATYRQALQTNITIHDAHNRVNPNVAKGLEERRKARTNKK
ncbi:MAG: enoyl-CoA hydratase/isomerase family protein [Deltaproteobacteria bacterium]|nr:enoyl-CoA hydratase/isomerase family protein [Deltaproteobacteria bacterium]